MSIYIASKGDVAWRWFSPGLREAVDALLLGINADELRRLDEASRHAEADIACMVRALDTNAKSHKAFMAEMARLRAASER